MAEFTAAAVQTVAINQNVLFTDTPVCGGRGIYHREGSGLVTAKGISGQCRARYRVSFGANIAVPTGGTVGPISLAIAINGEAVAASIMTVTPTVVSSFFNVNRTIFVDAPCGCCTDISVENVSTEAILVQNANLVVERVA